MARSTPAVTNEREVLVLPGHRGWRLPVGLVLQVKNDLTGRPDPVLWTMPPHSSSSYVGNANNDKADYFQCS